jgi:hypothetical protein
MKIHRPYKTLCNFPRTQTTLQNRFTITLVHKRKHLSNIEGKLCRRLATAARQKSKDYRVENRVGAAEAQPPLSTLMAAIVSASAL